MDTSQFSNNNQGQHIHELLEQSIKKRDRAAKKQKWLIIALACFVFFAWFPTNQSIAIRVCGAACVMLLCFLSTWPTTGFISCMSKARDVCYIINF